MSMKSTKIEDYFSNIEKPFLDVEEFGVSCQRCSNQMKDSCTLIRLVLNNNYERLKTIAEQLQGSGVLAQYPLLHVNGIDICGTNETPEEIWLRCSLTSKDLIENIFCNPRIKNEEAAYLLMNLLTILEMCDNLTKRGIPFAVNKACFMTVKDEASPFLKVVMTPLIFFIKEVVITNTASEEEAAKYLFEYHEFIASAIQTFCHVPGTDELVQAIRARKSCTELAQLNIVQDCMVFVKPQQIDLTQFTVEKKLGNGAFGVVFLVEKDGVKYAMKEVDKEHTPGLIREATIMKICDHPNIIKFIGFNTFNTSIAEQMGVAPRTMGTEMPHGYLVMECCDGGDLEELVIKFSKLGTHMTVDLVESIFAQILKSQFYLHFNKNIIHRDIKLDNYLVFNNSPYPIIKLSDFGFARALDGEPVTLVGTPLYNATEIFYGKEITDKRDLYSIGICLYRLITLQFPFGSTPETFFAAMKKRQEVQFPPEYENSEYKELIRLSLAMTKHKENGRISWEQLRDDPYVQMLLSKY